MTNLKKRKICFIVHDVYQSDNYFPLGVAYLATIAQQAGHEVQIFSQDIWHQSNQELALFLDNNNFDIIGLGFLAARYVETIRPLAKIINKHKKNAKFILGGHGVSAIPEYILKDLKADIAMLGEGEKIIVPLLEDIINKKDFSERDGIAVRINDKIKVNQRISPIMDLDSIPLPAWDLFPMEKYINCLDLPGSNLNDKTLAVLTSRGCINRCSFCYRMEQGIRLRSIDNLFIELQILNSKYGITYFLFVDEMFIPNKNRIKEFVTMLKKLETPIKYYCQARVEFAKDKEILKMLKESGCQIINFGLESLDQNVLDLMGKRVKVEDNHIAVQNTIEVGMHPGLNFMWGNPGDSLESLDKIVNFLLKYDTLGQLRTLRPPTPYPGCPLYYKAIKDRKLTGPADFFEKFKNSDRLTVNFTDMPDEEVYKALLNANPILIKNYYQKKAKLLNKNKEEYNREAEEKIESFKKVYFPSSLEDLKFRGARHNVKK